MNRREAIAALVSLPEVARISTVPAASDDVIVVECDDHISMEVSKHIKALMSDVWSNRTIVVLDKGMRLKVAPK